MRRKYAIIALAIIIGLLTPVMLSTTASAESSAINRNTDATYTPSSDGTWGGSAQSSQYFLWMEIAKSRYVSNEGRIQASIVHNAIGNPLPSDITQTAQVWKNVFCSESGYYSATISGHYRFNLNAFLVETNKVTIKYQIVDDNNNVIKSNVLLSQLQTYPYSHEYYGDLYDTLIWYGVAGNLYHIKLVIECFSVGWMMGASINDAYTTDNPNGPRGAWIETVHVRSTTSGGGGCVSGDTLISMADGTLKQASKLMPGDVILSYDIENERIINESVICVYKEKVTLMESINNGTIILTPLNQPIYIRNGSFEGWIKNPVDLNIGWEMFNPLCNSWVLIVNTDFIESKEQVYDIVATGPNNFVGGGILLDQKTL